jgi:hypothetical protein
LAHEQWIGIALAGSGPVHATFIVVAAWAWCLIRGNNLWAAEHGLANDQHERMKTNPGRHRCCGRLRCVVCEREHDRRVNVFWSR